MTTDEAEEQLKRVFTAFPSYRQFLRQLDEPNATLDAWIGMLVGSDAGDVGEVVDLIVRGDMEPTTQYQKPDMLPRNIKAAANERRGRRNDKRRQEAKYHTALEKIRSTDDRYRFTSGEAVRLGSLSREKKITPEENKERMEVLLRWDRGEDVQLYWLEGSVPA